MNTSLFKRLLIGSLVALCAACGGGGGSGTLADAGIGGSGITSVGPVTAVGSITVNGVKFDTQGATVTVDAAPGVESDLKVGLVVNVTGTLNGDRVTGTATRVEVDNELKGSVDAAPAITASGGTFTVFSQVVVVDDNTVFGNATGLADFPAGTAVEVSGFRDSAGQVRATRVEKTAAVPATIEVNGTIANVNNSASTFTLGSLSVGFGGAQRINFPAAGLANGLLVQVKAPRLSGGVLTATSVEVRPGGLGQESGEGRIEGFINGLTGSAPNFSFSVNGQSVSTDSRTDYDSGTSGNLATNIRVEIEGRISGGVLLATKVEFKEKNNNVKITAQVSAKSATATNLTVFGAPGVSATTDTSTIFQDNSSQRLRIFGFADVQPGDWLQLEAAQVSANSVAASKVVRINAPSGNGAILQGPLDRAALPDLFILGVDARTQTTTTFQDANGDPLNQATFFARISANTSVRISGQFTGLRIDPVTAAQLQDSQGGSGQ